MIDKEQMWGYYVGHGDMKEPLSQWLFRPARDWGLPLWEYGSLQPTTDGGWNLLLGKWLGYIDEQGNVHYHAFLQIERLKEARGHVNIRLTIPPWFRQHFGQVCLTIGLGRWRRSAQHWPDPYVLPKDPPALEPDDPDYLPF